MRPNFEKREWKIILQNINISINMQNIYKTINIKVKWKVLKWSEKSQSVVKGLKVKWKVLKWSEKSQSVVKSLKVKWKVIQYKVQRSEIKWSEVNDEKWRTGVKAWVNKWLVKKEHQ